MMGSGIVSKGVGRYTFLDAGPDGGFVHGLPDDLFGYRFVRTRVVHSAGEQVGLGAQPSVSEVGSGALSPGGVSYRSLRFPGRRV